MIARRLSVPTAAALFLTAAAANAAVTYFGPTPYAQRSDSPFATDIAEGTVHVEDFEDGALNTPFVMATCGGVTNDTRPSVDEDDGIIDGIGSGISWWGNPAPVCELVYRFQFAPDELGRLPNFVGFVVVGPTGGEFIDGQFVYRASPSVYDTDGTLLSDGRFFDLPEFGAIDSQSTYYSRFIGFTSDIGIAELTIGGVTRLDHLQYGYVTIPEPDVLSLALFSVVAVLLLRRRRP